MSEKQEVSIADVMSLFTIALGWWLWERNGRRENEKPEDPVQLQVFEALDESLREAMKSEKLELDEVVLRYMVGVLMFTGDKLLGAGDE